MALPRWPQGEHREVVAHHAGLTFAATVGHLSDAVRKLAAVATPDECRQPLWRGVRGELPRSFWSPDENGKVVAVDMGFMSTSRNRETPIDYMAEGDGMKNVLWCLKPQPESDAACAPQPRELTRSCARGASPTRPPLAQTASAIAGWQVPPWSRHLALVAIRVGG